MSPTELIAIIALVAYGIYRQTHIAEVTDHGRFKLAIIYGIVGICAGGFTAPHGLASTAVLVASIALSAVVGLTRGRLTRVWAAADGRIYRQGTAVTVGLFLALIVAKFGLGAYCYLDHVHASGGFGEIMMMMAVMVALQAELIKRRAAALRVVSTTPYGPEQNATSRYPQGSSR
jgi:hypothetical protein